MSGRHTPEVGGRHTGPRIPPGSLRELGPFGWAFSRAAGRVMGTEPPAVFTTLGRARGTFTGWLHFAGRLMPFGSLSRREAEVVILTVGTRRECEYELSHHRRIGRRAGLSADEVSSLTRGDAPPTLSEREAVLRATALALVEDRDLDDEAWARLRSVTSEREAVELLLLAGNYDMLATVLTTLRVQPDPVR
ncbi:AhpD family alkylhydroperoxidase [Knoellia remsis]|uniref:AhpD family alkylhydroperoxidase n=1 Tax=Knoellia remsis TaxID=407159 RepID=A0A2T0UQV9_9MICO|nr:carboxymuconolactone decarboxylase family protein [Knoellia remsis]PRY60315.1 AhpD family alkylhydroperoxidase [Knoellia remsis]